MTDWRPKRFWTEAKAETADGGYTIALDGRPVNTPGKTRLVLPTLSMATAIAAEWDAQSEVLDPATMPVTRSANSAIDKVAVQRAEVIDLLAAYGDDDLLCYRADAPAALVAQQTAAWDPWLDWAATTHDASLTVATGVMHIAQPKAALTRLRAPLEEADNFALTALHDLISLSGSLVLALAVKDAAVDPETAWTVSRLDEAWQISQWGEDAEAATAADAKRRDFLHAARFLNLSTA